MKDYASTEKVADLPKRLSTDGAPAGVDPDVGDITYYAPSGNLAIFYEDFGYSKVWSGWERSMRASRRCAAMMRSK